MENNKNSEETLSSKTTGKGESEDTLTNRQGHPVTDNQNVRTVGNRGPTTLENYDFWRKSATLTANGFPSASFTRAAPAHTDTLRRTEVLETRRFLHTQERKCFKRKE